MSAARTRVAALTAAALGLLLGCSGENLTEGANEPIKVLDAQFRDDAFPGLPPLTADEVNAGVMPISPSVTSISLPNALIPLGEPSRSISGRATLGAGAVAVKLADAGHGYWVVPTTNVDVLNGGEVEWRLRAAFGRNISPGLHKLLFAAVDAKGRSGTQGELSLCLSPEVPDNGNSCDRTVSPPALVISLGWDTPVDMDLRVVAPNGKVVDSKHPTSASEDEDGKLDPFADGAGVIDHDAFANCQTDGRTRENLVFQSPPSPGTYLIYANLFDSCGEPDVHFNVSMHVPAAGKARDTFVVDETYRQAGELQDLHENGGAALGMFVTSFVAH